MDPSSSTQLWVAPRPMTAGPPERHQAPNVHWELSSKIKRNAAYHAHLTSSLDFLKSAHEELKNQKTLLSDLRAQLKLCTNAVYRAADASRIARGRYEDTRRSRMRRWGAGLGGAKKKQEWEEKEDAEETAYMMAVREEEEARERKEDILGLEAGVLAEIVTLEAKVEEHAVLCKALEALYSDVFDGPTLSSLDEDLAEYAHLEAQRIHIEAIDILESETKATELLEQACRAMRKSMDTTRNALVYFKTYRGGGTARGSELMERSSLDEAAKCVREVQELVKKARGASRSVKPRLLASNVETTAGSIFTDAVKNNYFTNGCFHDKIHDSIGEVKKAYEQLKEELKASQERKTAATVLLSTAKDGLYAAWKELWDLRRAIFDSVVTSGRLADDPPRLTRTGLPRNEPGSASSVRGEFEEPSTTATLGQSALPIPTEAPPPYTEF